LIDENEDEKRVYQGDEYILSINEFWGHYYREADTVSLNIFKGYLFYNK